MYLVETDFFYDNIISAEDSLKENKKKLSAQ